MSDNLPRWHTAHRQRAWSSTAGLRELPKTIEPLSPFTPDDDQYILSARVMDGAHMLIIRATGSGKTMITIIPLLARPHTTALVIAPLNALESDLERRFQAFKLSAVVINRQTLRKAAKSGRNLWVEPRTANGILMGPEQIPTDDFEDLISNPVFRSRIAVTLVEEAHVIDLWSDEFREAYKLIATLRARLPPWVSFVGLTATCRPRLQTESIIKGMGFHRHELDVHRGDCERHDLNIVVRPILYGVSGFTFGDLDWLIPESATVDALLAMKTLVYCNSIKLGHRVTRYLRSLLPCSMQKSRLHLVRHTHSLCCDDCKQEALDALCDVEGALPCAIEVATDVIGFGVDARRVHRVVCFDVPDELNTLVQRFGRAGRDELEHNATAYIYLKKSTMLDAVATQLIADFLPPNDALMLEDIHSTVIDYTILEAEKQEHTDAHELAAFRLILSLQRASAKPKTPLELSAKTRAMTAIVQASMLAYCIVLRLNQLYGNPGITSCGRCSVCIPDTLPTPRQPSDVASDGEDTILDDATNVPRVRTRRKACMHKELVQQAAGEIEDWARSEWLGLRMGSSFFDSSVFLGDDNIRTLSSTLFSLKSRATLQTIIVDWKWQETHGDKLWTFISHLRSQYTALAAKRKGKSSKAQSTRTRKRHASTDDGSDSSDKENTSPAVKRRRSDRGQSPSPSYILPQTTTRFGRKTGPPARLYD